MPRARFGPTLSRDLIRTGHSQSEILVGLFARTSFSFPEQGSDSEALSSCNWEPLKEGRPRACVG